MQLTALDLLAKFKEHSFYLRVQCIKLHVVFAMMVVAVVCCRHV